jgi:hypothetical protein
VATQAGAREALLSGPLIRRNLQYVLGLKDFDSDSDDDGDEEHDEDDAPGDAVDGGGEALPVQGVEALCTRLGLASREEAATQSDVTLDGLPLSDEWRGRGLLVLAEVFPQAEALSLQGLRLGTDSDDEDALAELVSRMSCLRGLWLNDNPLLLGASPSDAAATMERIVSKAGAGDRLEIVNRCLTPCWGPWALAYLTGQSPSPHEGLPRLERLDLWERGLSLAHLTGPESPLRLLQGLRWLDLRNNPDLHVPRGAWRAELGRALSVLRCLEALWVDGDGEEERAGWTEIATAVPSLGWINGHAASRRFVLDGSSAGNRAKMLTGVRGVGRDGTVTVSRVGGPGGQVVGAILDSASPGQGFWGLAEPMRIAASSQHHPELYW